VLPRLESTVGPATVRDDFASTTFGLRLAVWSSSRGAAPVPREPARVLEHTAVVPPEMWDQFGPGAVGVGWDLALVGFAAHLAGVELGDPAQLETDPAMHELMAASSGAWGTALGESGASPDTVARNVEATTAFYIPPTE